MKFFAVLLFCVAISFMAVAQNSKKTEVKQASATKKGDIKSTPLPAADKDPVCFMKVKKGTLITSSYKGKLYGFCSDHCKQVFLADPEAQLRPVKN